MAADRHVVLVCGGRDFSDWKALYAKLDEIHAKRPITLIVSGAQRGWDDDAQQYVGADWIAIEWALARQIDFNGRPARWNEDGHPQAGPMRNSRQIKEHMPIDLCVACAGGPGTADVVKKARGAGVPVVKVGS